MPYSTFTSKIMPTFTVAFISSVKERFNQLQKINSKFGFLYHIDNLEDKPTKDVQEQYLKLEKTLAINQSKDVDAIELCGELQAISK